MIVLQPRSQLVAKAQLLQEDIKLRLKCKYMYSLRGLSQKQ